MHPGDDEDELAIVPSWTYRDFTDNQNRPIPKTTRVYFTDQELSDFVFRPYIFFVINVDENHWILALFYRMHDILDFTPQGPPHGSRTCLIIFDSLGRRHPEVAQNLFRFVEKCVMPRWGVFFSIRRLPVYYPKVSGLEFAISCFRIDGTHGSSIILGANATELE